MFVIKIMATAHAKRVTLVDNVMNVRMGTLVILIALIVHVKKAAQKTIPTFVKK